MDEGGNSKRDLVEGWRHGGINPIQAMGSFRDAQRFLSITLRAFEIIL